MNFFNLTLILFILCIFKMAHAQNLTPASPGPVDLNPQIQIGGTGYGTLSGFSRGNNNSASLVDFSDSTFLFDASQTLFNEQGVGSFSFGTLLLDSTNSGNGAPFFIHQGLINYQSKTFEIMVGRTDNPVNKLVMFPALRDEDLILYTNQLNPFANGKNIQEHRFSNVAALILNQDLTWFENIHAQYLINSQIPTSDANINSYGASAEYMSPPARDALQFISSGGIGYEYTGLYNNNAASGINAAYGGGVININQSVTDRIDLRIQDILTFGNSTANFLTLNDSYEADSNAAAAAIRYLHSPFGTPGYQLSFTGGAKTYKGVANSNSYGGALTGVKRLGLGFDLVAQYSYQWKNTSLAAVYNGISQEQVVTVGLIFDFMATFNQHVSPRRSLLNFGHEYVPN
jgi:hypothetical protein